MNHITKAEQAIGAILAELEQVTGQLVDDISIRNVEVTKLCDEREQFVRRVQLKLKQIPGLQSIERAVVDLCQQIDDTKAALQLLDDYSEELTVETIKATHTMRFTTGTGVFR